MQIRGRDHPQYRDLKDKFGGWIVRVIVPYGINAGKLTWMINFNQIDQVDPNELNDYLSMHCPDNELMIIGLSKRNQWKFAPMLEALSYMKNTVVFDGVVFNEDIMAMADERILLVPPNRRIREDFWKEFTRHTDQWIFQISGTSDFNRSVNAVRGFGPERTPIYFMPHWNPKDDEPVTISRYVYRHLSFAYRMIDAIDKTGLPIRVGLHYHYLLDTGLKGDPEFVTKDGGATFIKIHDRTIEDEMQFRKEIQNDPSAGSNEQASK